MKIHTIRIRNFRCFGENVQDEWGMIFRPNQNLNLVVGPNGSGKTAMLDAIDIVMNAEGRTNQALISEYDFPYCDTTKLMCIEVTLVDLGSTVGDFDSDIQWIDPADGEPIETKGVDLDEEVHQKAVLIRFEAKLDADDGEIKWGWFLQKFIETEMEARKEITGYQHWSLGYFRIRPTVTAGAFTLGQYSALGRHLRKLRFRLGKLPENLRADSQLPKCLIENPDCESCSDRADCIPLVEDESAAPEQLPTVGSTLGNIASGAKKVLGSHGWNQMNVSLGPRYGGQRSNLAALTLGLRTDVKPENPKFIPFERLSSGEKYAFSFSLARIQVPGDRPPVILMEEPETALYPSAIAMLIGGLQATPTGDAPQVIISSHSESVLRCFSTDNIFGMGLDRKPTSLQTVIDSIDTEGDISRRLEYLMMPGGPCSLFADKVLLVEGAQDAITSGHLDRLAAKITAKKKGNTYHSFSSLGWSILDTSGSERSLGHVKLLLGLGKKVAALFDADGKGKENAEKTKNLCPTFIYKSEIGGNPTLEDALLKGLPEKGREEVLADFYSDSSCSKCDKKETSCWVQRMLCDIGDRDDRKNRLQDLSLKHYRKKHIFPRAFEELWTQIDTTEKGVIHTLPIESST